jgi:hypothetical protein
VEWDINPLAGHEFTLRDLLFALFSGKVWEGLVFLLGVYCIKWRYMGSKRYAGGRVHGATLLASTKQANSPECIRMSLCTELPIKTFWAHEIMALGGLAARAMYAIRASI